MRSHHWWAPAALSVRCTAGKDRRRRMKLWLRPNDGFVMVGRSHHLIPRPFDTPPPPRGAEITRIRESRGRSRRRPILSWPVGQTAPRARTGASSPNEQSVTRTSSGVHPRIEILEGVGGQLSPRITGDLQGVRRTAGRHATVRSRHDHLTKPLRESIMKRQKHEPSHTDPVCGMEISRMTAADEFTWDGKTYYFCASVCREAFEADPEQYAPKHRQHGIRPE